MTKIYVYACLVLILAPFSLQGQVGSLQLSSGEGFAGHTITTTITMTTDTELHGFSFGVAHDPLLISIPETVNISQGPSLESLNLGAGPAFFSVNIAPAGGAGFTIACVTDLFAPFDTVPVALDNPILEIDYLIDANAPVGSTIPIEFSNLLGSPPVQTVMVFDLVEIVPTITAGIVTVTEPTFLRGDVDQNGTVSLIDGVLLCYRVSGLQPPGDCRDADDINDDDLLTISDAVYLFQYMFVGGPSIPAPSGVCGPDPGAEGNLDCNDHLACP